MTPLAVLAGQLAAAGLALVERDGWGAVPPTREAPAMVALDGLVWHHSGARYTGSTPAHDAAAVRGTQTYHMGPNNHLGQPMSDLLYSLMVGRTGHVFAGRSSDQLAHGLIRQSGGTGHPEDARYLSVCILGDFTQQRPTVAQRDAAGIIARFVGGTELRDGDINSTACPGQHWPTNLAAHHPAPTTPTPTPEVDAVLIRNPAGAVAVILGGRFVPVKPADYPAWVEHLGGPVQLSAEGFAAVQRKTIR